MEAGYDKPEDIAPHVGRSWRRVRDYEAGAAIPEEILGRWAEVTGKPVDYFLEPDPEPRPKLLHHPGLEKLARDPKMMRSLNIASDDIAAARTWNATQPNGQPLIIETITQAVEVVQLLQRLRRTGVAPS